MRKMVWGMLAGVGMMVMVTTVFGQTNLIVVRHMDNTLWKMTCEGTLNCSGWTQIPGMFSLQPTLTWDPVSNMYILIGIGNNGSSIWRSTFDADGTWNTDWVLIGTGTTGSPSPGAAAGGNYGAIKGIYVVQSPLVNTGIGVYGTATAACDAGDRVLGGGHHTGARHIYVGRSFPETDSSWTVSVEPIDVAIGWYAYAVCLKTN
jgi:hypothetical protein